jgi:hypothetical protein
MEGKIVRPAGPIKVEITFADEAEAQKLYEELRAFPRPTFRGWSAQASTLLDLIQQAGQDFTSA